MSDSQANFELGKQYLDEEREEEAVRAFAEAVAAEPDNALYHAWYARALRKDRQFDEAIGEASLAIQLDPGVSMGYQQRGFAYKELGDTDKAIADFSSAIRLDPENESAYWERMWLLRKEGDWEQHLHDRIHYHDLGRADAIVWSTSNISDQKKRASREMINDHFKQQVAPQIEANKERMIGYWPTIAMVWDRRDTQTIAGGGSFNIEKGMIGQGYICLSAQYLRIVSLSKLPARFQLSKGASLIRFFLPVPEQLESSKQDHFWKIPVQDITGVQLVTDETIGESVRVSTGTQSWFIVPYFDDNIIIAGLNMARSGKFSKTEGSQTSEESTVIDLIRQLGELRSNGLITEAEYESKKSELLSRL